MIIGEKCDSINPGIGEIAQTSLIRDSASKAAVNAISDVLVKELAPRKIRVNVVSPGFVVTEGTKTCGIAANERRRSRVQDSVHQRWRHADTAGIASII